MTRRAKVKVKSSSITRVQAAAEFSRKKVKQRRQLWKRRAMMVGGVAFVAYAGLGGWWLIHTGKIDKALEMADASFWQMTADAGFRVDQVYLEGRQHADFAAVKTALGVVQGAPILSLSLPEMKQRLQAVPEVKSVSITRVLPNRLSIALMERVPVAVWEHDGTQQLVDSDGVVLVRQKYTAGKGLPVMVGDDAPKHVGELVALLDSAPGIKPDVVAAVRVGGRRWNMQLQHDIVVMLPEDAPLDAWKRFADLVDNKGLLTKAIRSVDMRMEDRVFIMPVEEKKSPITLTTARDT